MAISDNKITNAEIAEVHVQAAPDTLTGSAQQNKAVFDAYSDLIAGKFNDLIDEIVGPHGDEIKVAVDEWLAEHPEATTTVQDNSLTTAKYVDGSVTEPKIAERAVTPTKLDRTYSTPADLASVNANLTNELNVLDARMDEFASLPEGSTTADAELIDIRVGADGTPYPTAGDAVRRQVADLKSDFANFTNLSDALIDDTNYIINLNTAFKQGVVHNRAYSNPDTTDTITTYSNLFRKKYLPFNLHVDIANGYKVLMVFYSSDVDTSAITGTWLTGNNTVADTVSTLSEDYFCVEVRKTDNTAITPSEATNAVSVYYSMPLLADRKKVVNIQADSTSALTITETCDICGNGHTINVGQNAEFGLHILGDTGVVVNVYDLTIKGGYESAVRVNHFATVNFYNCSFEDAANHGLSVVNSNTNCFDCIAQNNGVDGYNYHLKGKNTVYNCNGINNGDDGISNHEESSLKIVGGRFIGNGKAGIACPTYGAGNTEILDVYCADNVQYGILAHNDTALTDKVIVQNAIITGSPKGATIRGYQAIFNNVKFADCTTNTETGNGGTITAM